MTFVGFLPTIYYPIGIQLDCSKYILEGRKEGRERRRKEREDRRGKKKEEGSK